MMKLRILLLNLLVVYTIHFMAQESYSNDVTCVKADDNIAVITASGTAEKKKDEMCIRDRPYIFRHIM